jgi:cobalt-zinc-cadmium efflux system protein
MSGHHHHEHNHAESTKNFNHYFAIGVSLNFLFVIVEIIFGIITGSLALIADAGHNLSDVISLILAWIAHYLATKDSNERRTYGFKKLTILTSLISSIMLLVALGGIIWEAIQRISSPRSIEGMPIIVVASIGVLINGITAFLFAAEQKDDLNIRGAYLHMLADAGVSLSVVVSGIFILTFHWVWIDPVITIGIAISILVVTWGLLRDSIQLSLDFVPRKTNFIGIKSYLLGLENVVEVHDLHIWAISTRETALTVHLVVHNTTNDDGFLNQIQKYLHDQHQIEHSTIQIEHHTNSSHAVYDPKCN